MHFSTIITSMLAIGSAVAVPTTAPVKYCGYKNYLRQLTRFENANPGVPLVVGSAIGINNDIMFNGMTLTMVTLGTNAIGVIPESPNNCAAFGPTVASTIMQGTPAMLTNYPDSTVKSFDFYSFFFGVVLADQNSVASKPLSGTLTVIGYPSSGGTVSQTFTYKPDPLALQQQMIKATLSDKFRCLTKVEFKLDSSSVVGLAKAVLADTFDYQVYGNGKLGPN